MESLDDQLRQLLEKHEGLFTVLPNGKIQCEINGHTLPPRQDVVAAFIQGAKFQKMLQRHQAENALQKYEPFIVQSKNFPLMLYCALTGQLMDKTVAAVKKHMQGKKFARAKERFQHDEIDLQPEPSLESFGIPPEAAAAAGAAAGAAAAAAGGSSRAQDKPAAGKQQQGKRQAKKQQQEAAAAAANGAAAAEEAEPAAAGEEEEEGPAFWVPSDEGASSEGDGGEQQEAGSGEQQEAGSSGSDDGGDSNGSGDDDDAMEADEAAGAGDPMEVEEDEQPATSKKHAAAGVSKKPGKAKQQKQPPQPAEPAAAKAKQRKAAGAAAAAGAPKAKKQNVNKPRPAKKARR